MTRLNDLVNPQVMADMTSAEYEKKLQMIQFAEVDNTLEGQAGNTITVPKWTYIGEATDLAEGESGTTSSMTKTTTQATIKKAFKGIELSDEAVLSGYGDPMGEAAKQLGMSLADKVDSDLHASLATIGADMTSENEGVISYAAVVNAIDLFQDEEQGAEAMYAIIHPKQLTQLRLDAKFTPASEMGDSVIATGVVGTIAGANVILSKKVKLVDGNYVNYVVKPGALKIYNKRGVTLESDRDITKKATILTADQHYATVLSNTSKAVKFVCAAN